MFLRSQSICASSSALSLLHVLSSSWVFGLPFVGSRDVACGVSVPRRTPPFPAGVRCGYGADSLRARIPFPAPRQPLPTGPAPGFAPNHPFQRSPGFGPPGVSGRGGPGLIRRPHHQPRPHRIQFRTQVNYPRSRSSSGDVLLHRDVSGMLPRLCHVVSELHAEKVIHVGTKGFFNA